MYPYPRTIPRPEFTREPRETEYESSVSVGITPFIRENDINFAVRNLKPDASANIFFDEIKVNSFSQRASIVNVVNPVVLSTLKINQGLFCATSKAYAEVLGTSATGTQNLIYVNDNFITLKVVKGGGAVDLSDDEYRIDQLVYQTPDNSIFTYTTLDPSTIIPRFSFVGRVKAWEKIDASTGYLVVDPISGRANTSTTSLTSHRVWNMTSPTINIREASLTFANNRFQANEVIRYASNLSPVATISSTNAYVALSSAVSGANITNLRSIVLSSNNITRDGISTIVGNTITIVSGTNMGFSANIVAVVANTANGFNEAIIDAPLPVVCTSNSIYSLGNHIVDDVGSLYGIFHIPSEPNLRWLTGERTFTVTDTATFNDNNYKMRAIGKYSAVGKTNTSENARNPVLREQTPSTQQAAPNPLIETQKVNDRKYMAQTFFTPRGNQIVDGELRNAYGVYLTSVDLFFKSKPEYDPENPDATELLPFTVAISKVQGDLPGNDIIAERTLEPTFINVSNFPSLTDSTTYTKFTFTDPVYLLPGTEYAIKLISESPDYEVWTATLGQEYVDSAGNVRRISDEPYIGRFFKSQNASNWNPIINQDLMFRLNRAEFNDSHIVYFNLKPSADLRTNTIMDLVKISSTEQQFAPTSIQYEIDTYQVDGSRAGYIKINNNEIYSFGGDTDISSVGSTRRRYIPVGDQEGVNVRVTMATTDNTVAPIVNSERFGLFALQNIINNAGIANNLISITSGGNHQNVANIVVNFSDPDVGSNRAAANILPSMLASNSIIGINITNPGSGYFTTPTITILEGNAPANATAIVSGETDKSGGNILAKYQTKIVRLNDQFEAGDLIVRLDAIRPIGTEIAVYFKVLSALDTDPFSAKKWQKMILVNDYTSPDQTTIVPLEYRHSLTSGTIEYFDGEKTLPVGGKFKFFAIKIRMTAEDPTVIPAVEALRVIAVPGD